MGLFLYVSYYDDYFSSKEVNEFVAKNLYSKVEINSCNYVEDNILSKSKMLYHIFSYLKRSGHLNDKIAFSRYNDAFVNIFGIGQIVPDSFKDYEFDGYLYTMSGDVIERKKSTCSNVRYVSYLESFNGDNKEVELNIRIGYIKNNEVYDLNGEKIGTYTAGDYSSALNSGPLKIYVFKKESGEFFLSYIK